MPVKKCNEGGKSGWKWGDEGVILDQMENKTLLNKE